MDDITIGVTEYLNNIQVTAQPNDQQIDIAVTETVETVLLDVSTTVEEVTVTATQNVIVENITVDYVNNENNIDINVTDATQDVTLNVTPTLVEINILRSGGEVNILQFDSLADFPATGSSDYFYLAKDTNKLYRWTGSAYAEISATANAVWGQIIGTLSEQTDLQNALNLKAPINSPTFTGTVSGITKAMVGLAQVDNTSDLDKPISTATQTALNNKQPLDADLTSIAALSGTAGLLKKVADNSYTIDTNTYLTEITSTDVTDALGFTPENAANKGIANGYASLDGGGKVPSSQLPSYVDDVIEVANYGSLPSTGETGKIYITLDTNKIYRWTGSVYVEVSSSAAVWGGITGTLSNQTDLQSALDAKQDDLNGTGFVKASGTTISYDNTTYYPTSNPNGYTTNTGTVTSVALSVPSAFSVSGSPITSSGTLAISATGDTTQYIAGDGSLVTFPTTSTAGTLIREVRNTTGATLTKGTVVYISGATGNKPTVSKALATGDNTSAQTFGLVQADIANNANGNVVCVGDLTGVDTSALTEGAQLYLSSTTAGTYTTTKQYAPNHLVYIGIVTRAHPTLGQIEVKIQNGYELDELHNVAAQTPSNNDGLFYESSTSLWKNKSISTVLGYTPQSQLNGTGFVKVSGTTVSYDNSTYATTSDLSGYVATSGTQSIAGNKTFTGFAYFDNTIFLKQTTSISFISGYNSIAASSSGIRMGITSGISALFDLTSLTANRDYTLPNSSGTLALTSDLHNAVTIGTANGLSLSTQVLSLALASTSTTGALSSTDWNTFNGKQNALTNPVTGTGTTNYLSKFTGTSAVGNSLLYDTGSALLIGATTVSDGQSTLEVVGASTVGLKIISTGGNGNNTFLSIQSSKEWRFLTNRGDLISGNQGDLIIRNNTDSINHIILNQGGSTTFAGSVTASDLITASYGTARIQVTSTSNSANAGLRYTAKDSTGTSKNAGIYYVAGTATSNTFLSLAADDNTYQFNVLASGNIGIGTTAPESFSGYRTTEVSAAQGGVIFAKSTTGSITAQLLSDNQNAGGAAVLVGSRTNHPVIFTTNNVERLRIATSGAATFSSSVTAGTYLMSVGQLPAIVASSTFIDYISTNVSRFASTSNATNTYAAIAISQYSSNGSLGRDAIYITSAGNVGIGTSSPSTILQIVSSTNTTPSVYSSSSTNYSGWQLNDSTNANRGGIAYLNSSYNAGGIYQNNGVYLYCNTSGGVTLSAEGANNIYFATNGSEKMRIDSSGNLIFYGQSSSKIQFYNAYSGSPANVGLALFNTSGTTVIALNANGGGIYSASLGTGLVYSSGGSLTSTNPSDSRLKENIKSISYGLADIMKLRPVSYNWKTDTINQGIQFGFIAQEVQEVMPDAIKEFGEETKFLGLEKDAIYATLVNAIKELNKKIETLENK